MKKDVVERCYLSVHTGEFTWPEIVLGLAEVAGRVIGESVQNNLQAQELAKIAQQTLIQAIHTAGIASQKGNSLILPE
jgi:hypothetical protein